MPASTIYKPDRTVLWQQMRTLWDQDVPAATLLPMLKHYIELIESDEGRNARSLIAPLRWLGLLHHILQQHDHQRVVLARCCNVMERHIGPDHPQTVQCLILLLGVRQQEQASAEQMQIALHFLAKRRHRIDGMDPRLLESFVHALYEPLAGNCGHNRTAFALLRRHVLRQLNTGSTPDASACHRMALCWHLAREVERVAEMVPAMRLLANALANSSTLDEVAQEQLVALRSYIRESTMNLPRSQLNKIRPDLKLVQTSSCV